MTPDIQKFIGNGLVFPIVLTADGKVPVSSGFELIESSIRIIVGWVFGTRFFLPEFGSRLEDLLEEPNDAVLNSIVKHYLIEAITRWEKRITPLEITVKRKEEHNIDIHIKYQIINSRVERLFIFPYYSELIY